MLPRPTPTRSRLGPVAGLAFVATLLAAPGAAQSGHNLDRPEHWKARYDDGAPAPERRFVVMRPGWHVFAGPDGLFWDPGRFASGAYSVSSTIFLFPEGDPEQSGSVRLDSPYGLFLGGRALDEEDAAWVAFELRNDGRFRIAEHSEGDVRDLAPWTAHDAVETLAVDAHAPLKNVLSVDVREDRVVFFVNESEVAALPRDRLPADGVIGLRAGAGLSLHVTEIAIGPNRPGE